jgi:hypothetical protein
MLKHLIATILRIHGADVPTVIEDTSHPQYAESVNTSAIRLCWAGVAALVDSEALLYMEDRDAAGNDVGFYIADDTSPAVNAIGTLLCD